MRSQRLKGLEETIKIQFGSSLLLQLGYLNSEELKEVLETRFEQRFGDIETSNGFTTLNQLVQAMTIQAKEETGKGKHRLLGEILIDAGSMNESNVKKVLDSMQK